MEEHYKNALKKIAEWGQPKSLSMVQVDGLRKEVIADAVRYLLEQGFVSGACMSGGSFSLVECEDLDITQKGKSFLKNDKPATKTKNWFGRNYSNVISTIALIVAFIALFRGSGT